MILLCLRPVPADLYERIKGGLHGSAVGGVIYADYLLEMTTRGDVVWEWRSWEHLDFETAVITLQDRREEWTHGNTVAELPDGNLVLSFRNISTVAIIEAHRRDLVEARRAAVGPAARSAPTAQRQPVDLRQRRAPTRSSRPVLSRDRGRPSDERDRVGVSRPVAIRFLQPLNRARPPRVRAIPTRGRCLTLCGERARIEWVVPRARREQFGVRHHWRS